MRKLAGKILLLINILFALLLVLTYTAPFINPGIILFPAFLGLAYPYILLVNVLFLVYWIIRFRKELLISLVAILLGWGHLTNLLPMNLRGSDDPAGGRGNKQISVMSYNVRTFDQYNWSKRENPVEGIFSTIDERKPDIVCFQEFYTVDKRGRNEETIRNELVDYPHDAIYYSLKSSASAGFGIATFSRYPIVRTNRIPFDNSMNQAIYTDVLFDKDTIRVFNIHLQSIRFGQENYNFLDSLSLKYSNRQLEEMKAISKRLQDAFIRRAEQAVIIRNYIDASPHPVIVTGDFNDTPISYSYHKIRKGLVDTFREAGSGLGNTYAGELPSYRIDFILCSKDLQAIEFRRIKTKYSDHFPIFTTLRWRSGYSHLNQE